MKSTIAIILSIFLTIFPCFCFADTEPQWQNVTTQEELVAAWKAYVNSRNVYNSSDPVSQLVTWEYQQLKEAAEKEGIDLANLQAGLHYIMYEESGITGKLLKFSYSNSAWNTLNQLFSRYALQNNIIANHGSKFNEHIYEGYMYTSPSGIKCFVFVLQDNTPGFQATLYDNNYGSKIKYTGTELYINGRVPYNDLPNVNDTYDKRFDIETNNLVDLNFKHLKSSTYEYIGAKLSSNTTYQNFFNIKNGLTIDSYDAMFLYNNQTLHYGMYNHYTTDSGNVHRYAIATGVFGEVLEPENYLSGSDITSKSTGVNEAINTTKDVAISIARKGAEIGYNALKDYIEDDDDPESKPYFIDDDEPLYPNPDDNTTPTGPTYPSGTVDGPNGPLITLPDLDDLIPDPSDIANSLPNNFKIQNLQYKFPFCIPFDLIAVFEFLDTEPEAPEIYIEKPFPHLNYDIDFNLDQYDDAMAGIRKFWLILYIFGLLFITPQVLKT